ncbi:hypothetical protein Athai_58550 [Actinocatenispora thailandica]|uniref:Uncharacterized protein n=1 Tax=Actinocatenispora thailandica TaxID=227318 RepID=A0A7R7DV07_9ACTN|nr:hypothetical protein [Actinocatenispora thailandica]BCJ38352.1 hypothetical protein Athai_58550 [Actinocatenispora thailandica]
MDAATYAAAICAAFLVGVLALGALAVYLLDRATSRRGRATSRRGRESSRRGRAVGRLRDPYAEAQALAARRRAGHVGRARVPVVAGRGGSPWS